MKRFISLLVSSFLVIGLLAGCGQSGQSTDNATSAVASANQQSDSSNANNTSTEKSKITFWYYWDSKNQQEWVTELTKKFNESQNEVEMTSQYVVYSDYKKQLSIGLAASNLPDIAVADNPDHASYAAMGLFADITDKIKDWADKDQYFDGPWKSATYNGKCYGIPITSNCLALYYNEDMLTKAGVTPPQTWDELKATAKTLTGNGTTGFAFSAVKGGEGVFGFMPFLLSAGATVETPGSAEAVKSLDYLLGLVKDGSMSREVINWTQADVLKQFMAGKVAMMLNGPWQIPTLQADAPDLKWNVVKVPKDKEFVSVLGGENIGIINGNNVDAAMKFLTFMGSADMVKENAIKFGMFPPRKDIATDKTWTDDPILKVFMDQMAYAQPRGPHPKWSEISTALSTELQQVLTEVKTPDAAATEAQAAVDKILK